MWPKGQPECWGKWSSSPVPEAPSYFHLTSWALHFTSEIQHQIRTNVEAENLFELLNLCQHKLFLKLNDVNNFLRSEEIPIADCFVTWWIGNVNCLVCRDCSISLKRIQSLFDWQREHSQFVIDRCFLIQMEILWTTFFQYLLVYVSIGSDVWRQLFWQKHLEVGGCLIALALCVSWRTTSTHLFSLGTRFLIHYSLDIRC